MALLVSIVASDGHFFEGVLALVHLPSQAGVHVLPSTETSAFAVALMKSGANTMGSLN